MNNINREEMSILTSLECLIQSSKADGTIVGKFEDIQDTHINEFLTIEGFDVKATFKKISEWIAKFITKISMYIRTTLAQLSSSNNLDISTVKALRKELIKLTDGSKLSDSQKRLIRNNRALLVSALIFSSKPTVDITGGTFGLSLSDIDDALISIGVKPKKIRVNSDDIVVGVTIYSAKGNQLSIGYITSSLNRGVIDIDCSIVSRESKSYDVLSGLSIIGKDRIEELYRNISDAANNQTKRLYETPADTLERDDIYKIKDMIGFTLSVLVKHIMLIKDTNSFVVKIAMLEASKE